MRSHANERGFTVVETLLATALLITLALATLGIVSAFARAVGSRGSASGGSATTENVLVGMRNDAATAFAVFVPSTDVFGVANGRAGVAPHEVDFYAKAQDGAESWWAYSYNSADATVRRWDYVPSPGAASTVGVLDRATGRIDAAASYPAMTGVRSFSAHTLQASDLVTASNSFGPVLASLSAAAGVAPQAEPVGFVPNSNQPRGDLFGGNTTVEVSLQTEHSTRTLHLATTTAPSGFTLHLAPSIRAIIYRKDYGHRFWFGFAQKTWARIFEQLQYSYTPKNEPWKAWCDFELYGSATNGLSLGDKNASYHPDNWDEATAGVFYRVTQGSVAGLNASGCDKKLPTRAQAPATPAPPTQQSEVIETPPPCFTAGQCWPQNAPENWAPPGPLPPGPPPAQWCATHADSTLCGGAGGTPVPVGERGSPPDPALTAYPPPEPRDTDPPGPKPVHGPIAL